MSKEALKIGVDLGTEKDEQCAVIILHYDGIDHIIYETHDKEQIEALNKIKQQESIDNAEPSEALECLEKLKGMEISSMPFSDEYGTQEVDLNDIRKVGSQLNTDFREYTATIKQALLKAQEPKKYLKWEDLEFKKDNQRIKVKLGSNIYTLDFYIGQFGKTFVLNLQHYCEAKENKQFFNDLHLERVEE